jgi:carbon-monoxide dehydrogenase medium subunit/xanthine dehydrogenase FAD-binding subunit
VLIELRRGTTKAPKVVLDISGVPELGGIEETDGSITIKPLTTHTELARSDLLRQFAPLLGSAASAIGSPQIRDRGTVGGNVMNAAACADTVPPLVALGATVTLQSKGSCREVPLADLFVKPYQTKAQPDELLTAIRFPKLPPDAHSAFIKLGRRNALAISRMSVAAVLQIGTDGRITEARIVPGAAFPTWKRVPEAEQMLVGQKPEAKLFAAAGQKVSEEMIKATGRRWSTEYKEPVIAVLVRRALEQCAKGASPKSSAPYQRGVYHYHDQWALAHPDDPRQPHAAGSVARSHGPAGHEVRLRDRRVRRVHCPARWGARELLSGPRAPNRRARSRDGRGAGAGRQAAPVAGIIPGPRCRALRLLHTGDVAQREGPAGLESTSDRDRHPHGHFWQPLPLHGLPADRAGH